MKRTFIVTIILSLFCFAESFAQTHTIKGRVTDEQGQAVSGATLIWGRTNRAIGSTEDNGTFSLNVPGDGDLVVRAVGYGIKTIRVNQKSDTYNITLQDIAKEIEETVVVGHVARNKETLTGSAIKISGKDIQDVPAASFTDLLQGKVPGMNVQLNTGTPGMRGNIAIRGISNMNIEGSGDNAFLTPTSPLFVIDGVPVDEGENYEYGFETAGPGISPISMIPVEDIEDITVLKDAQATALYGSKGAYGVILVTTKRGNSKIPIIAYTGQFFVGTTPSLRQVLGGVDERRTRINQIMSNDTTYFSALDLINKTPMLADSLNAYYNNNTDWQSYFYRTTMNTTHTFNISGGDVTFNYKIAPSYHQQKGIIENTGFTRYATNMNMQYMPNNRFKMSVFLNPSLAKNSTGSGNAFRQSGVAESGNTSSLLPPPSLFSGSVAALSALSMVNDNKTGNLNSQLELEYSPINDLRLVTTFGYNYKLATQDRFLPEALNANQTESYTFNDRLSTLYNRNMITYNKTFNLLHTISAYAFNEVEISNFQSEAMKFTGTPNDQITSGLSYLTRRTLGGTFNNLYERRTLGYAANFSYNYDSKYILELTYRLDGTSTTGTSNPWAHLPNAGFRWNFKNESFMEDVDWLDYGVVRGTWGKTSYPTGTIFDVFGKYSADYETYNNQTSVGLDLGAVPNIDLLPQTSTQLNGAIELGFLDQFTILYENYYKQSDQILRKKEIANINAFGNVQTNETSLVNMGHEFMLGYRSKEMGKFRMNLNLNGAINRDYTAALPDAVRQLLVEDDSEYNQMILYRLGIHSLSNVLLHYKGVYETDDDVPVNPNTGLKYRMGGTLTDDKFFKAGDPIWTDLNGDYILDENDYVIVGNSQPIFTGGFNAFFQYDKWALNTQFSITLKRDVLNNAFADRLRNYGDPIKGEVLVPITDIDIWTPQNPVNAGYANPFDFRRYGAINPFRYDQTVFMEDGSYVKFNTATLSYNFDREKLTRTLGITSARVYLSANNIMTFSKYSGPDPELVSALGRDSSSGYPRAREFTLGINIQF